MNILVPDSWLREYLKTKATPKQVAEDLSLCSQSVEKTTKVGEDSVYEIEITTNRPDCLSIFGIARELAAILPRFGIPAKLRPLPITNHSGKARSCSAGQSPITKKTLPLEVKIANPSSCPRFTALIFDNIKIKPSPKVIQERLEKSGIRALNNVVDISNYLMLELGQPMHTFDYDKILGAKMFLREAKEGESLETLDGQVRNLPSGTIIIEDGKGRIIDLCGIMGGENSAVDENTKRVLLFIQTYDPSRIRRTCQQMAFRTEAASRFEKSVDPEGVILAMKKAVVMFEKNCEACVASNLIDIYPNPPKQKTIRLDLNLVNRIIGVEIPKNEIINILKSLGFSLITNYQLLITVKVPHWRASDVSLPEDLIEEIARIYGYHNLPPNLPSGEIPKQTQDKTFFWQQRAKNALRFWGFNETFNYSLISEQNLRRTDFDSRTCQKVTNPLSEEWVYLRPSLVPSLLEVAAKNQDEFEKIQVFELANIYLPLNNHQLPKEIPMLSGILTKTDFPQTKGIIEALLGELGIDNYQIQSLPDGDGDKIFSPNLGAQVVVGKEFVGKFGEVNPTVVLRFGIKGKVYAFHLDFTTLAKLATSAKKFHPLPKYPAIIEDLSFVVPPGTQVGDLVQLISGKAGSASGGKSVSSIIKSVELLDAYRETRTFRVTYQSLIKTLSGEEVNKIREKIIREAQKGLGARLKS